MRRLGQRYRRHHRRVQRSRQPSGRAHAREKRRNFGFEIARARGEARRPSRNLTDGGYAAAGGLLDRADFARHARCCRPRCGCCLLRRLREARGEPLVGREQAIDPAGGAGQPVAIVATSTWANLKSKPYSKPPEKYAPAGCGTRSALCLIRSTIVIRDAAGPPPSVCRWPCAARASSAMASRARARSSGRSGRRRG